MKTLKEIKYLALLRGINVGGNNIIKMADLKACLEKLGLTEVTTFIQSGNVVFGSTEKSQSTLTEKIEKALAKQFNYKAQVMLVSHAQLKSIVKGIPKGFGKTPDKFRYNVIFLKQPLSAQTVAKTIALKEGVDQAYPGKGVLYFVQLISKASQSKLAKVISTPFYKNITIRNWNTTSKLLALMEK